MCTQHGYIVSVPNEGKKEEDKKMLVKTINTAYELQEEFRRFGRDYYSYEACEKMLEYFDEFDTPVECDIIGLCGDFTEAYPEDICHDYEYTFCTWDGKGGLTWDELMSDPDEAETRDEWIHELVNTMNEYTCAWELSNGQILYVNY